jgi:hypothetical protein
MPVIINELEVITDQPQVPADPEASQRNDVAKAQAARELTPDVLLAVWLREHERCSRSYAG